METLVRRDPLLTIYLLELGADPNALSLRGKDTTLHFAALGGDIHCTDVGGYILRSFETSSSSETSWFSLYRSYTILALT